MSTTNHITISAMEGNGIEPNGGKNDTCHATAGDTSAASSYAIAKELQDNQVDVNSADAVSVKLEHIQANDHGPDGADAISLKLEDIESDYEGPYGADPILSEFGDVESEWDGDGPDGADPYEDDDDVDSVSVKLEHIQAKDQPAGPVAPEGNTNAQAGVDVDAVSVQLEDVQAEEQQTGPPTPKGKTSIQADDESAFEDDSDVEEDLSGPQLENIHAPHQVKLPSVMTTSGTPADLITPPTEFQTWDDYKIICLAGPKVKLVLDQAGGEIELICSRKLLADFSDKFQAMDHMDLEGRYNITRLLQKVVVRSATSTFIQLYEMMEGGGLALPVSGEIHFLDLVELHLMANYLGMDSIKGWLEIYGKARIQQLTTTWAMDYHTAEMLETVPVARRNLGHFPVSALSPMELQAARLLDIQEAWMEARCNPNARVVRPVQLAQLASGACPAELRFQVQAAGNLRPAFIQTLDIHDLKRRVEARRGVNAG